MSLFLYEKIFYNLIQKRNIYSFCDGYHWMIEAKSKIRINPLILFTKTVDTAFLLGQEFSFVFSFAEKIIIIRLNIHFLLQYSMIKIVFYSFQKLVIRLKIILDINYFLIQ